MNTNILKKFARDSRTKLLSQVEAKLTYILNTDTVELRSKEKQVNELYNAALTEQEFNKLKSIMDC